MNLNGSQGGPRPRPATGTGREQRNITARSRSVSLIGSVEEGEAIQCNGFYWQNVDSEVFAATITTTAS